jgi:hypothetical protein
MEMFYALMQQHAALLSYADFFLWTAVLAFVCAIATWLFRKQAKHADRPLGVHGKAVEIFFWHRARRYQRAN